LLIDIFGFDIDNRRLILITNYRHIFNDISGLFYCYNLYIIIVLLMNILHEDIEVQEHYCWWSVNFSL